MWLLRSARKNRWENRRAEDSAHVSEAAKDVTLRPGEDGLSLFEVKDEEEGERVATRLGVHRTLTLGRSEHVDYLLIPPETFVHLGLNVVPVPDPRLEAPLSERHREAKGLSHETSLRLAATILRSGRFHVNRIKKQDVEKALRGG